MKPTLLHSTAIIFALLFFFLMSNAQSFHLVKDLNSGLADGSPKFLSSYNGKLYFDGFSPASGQGIFVSDGTDAGTVFLAEGQLGGYSELGFGCGLNGKFYFALGGELWVSDGTLAGTRNVKNINPINPDDPMYFTPHNNKIYFSATDGDYNYEMWSTDGTTLGTTQVKDIHPSDGSYPRYFCSYNNNLLFAANNGIFGYQLWKTDISGMTDTVCIHSDGIGSPEQLTVFNNKVYYYSVPPGMLGALCVTDGTLQGTRFVKKINPFDDDYIDNIIAFNGRLFFTATDTVGTELWTSDGSEMGTQRVKDINPFGDSYVGSGGLVRRNIFTPFNGKLYFFANDYYHGYELWSTDGTPNGTKLVKDINPVSSSKPSFDLESMVVFNNRLYFKADDGTNGIELWSTDGTDTGTHKITPPGLLKPNPLNNYGNLAVMGNSLYMGADFDSAGYELWRLGPDGISVGLAEEATEPVLILHPNPATTQLTINLGGLQAELVSIYNIDGKLISQLKHPQNNVTDINELEKGFYIIDVKTKETSYQKRWVKL